MQVLAVYAVIAAVATCAILAWAAQGATLTPAQIHPLTAASGWVMPSAPNSMNAVLGPVLAIPDPICPRVVGLEVVAAAFRPVYCANSKRWRDPVTKRYVSNKG